MSQLTLPKTCVLGILLHQVILNVADFCDICNKISCFCLIVLEIDECLQPDTCRPELTCNNTVGSYRCQCPLGFIAEPGPQNTTNPVCLGKELNL